MMPILDRRIPSDWVHVERYPLTAEATPEKPRAVIAGSNWYPFMDTPVWDASDQRWWIGRGLSNDRWGRPRGGHCYVFKPESVADPMGWYRFYDQGEEGACVGFGCARAMSLEDRKRFDAWSIYDEARRIDEWEGEDYDGTSVRAGLDVLRRDGASIVRAGRIGPPKPEHGIVANRWMRGIDEANAVLKSPRLEAQGIKCILNSWGELRSGGRRGYPHFVYIADEQVDRLYREYGELAAFTPR